jgi:microcystin-dependent protein
MYLYLIYFNCQSSKDSVFITNQFNHLNLFIMDGYLGEIKMFAGTFAPMSWLFCWGQPLPIAQYSSLYSIIGIQFGGDGINNFNLPDLRGRVPIGAGTGTGLTPRNPADKGGLETVALTIGNLPLHNHAVKCDVASPPTSQTSTPVNNYPASTSAGTGYAPGTGTTAQMNTNMTVGTGGNQSHENMPPFGCLNYIICVEGIWPPRD